ncbi:MAG: hypothetical protein ACR2FO_01150 [Actinomycetota bacterium]
MKIAVSLPDGLFSRAESAAQRLGKTRSRLFQEAVEEYLNRRDPPSVTEAMNRALADVGVEIDPWLQSAQSAALERVEW